MSEIRPMATDEIEQIAELYRVADRSPHEAKRAVVSSKCIRRTCEPMNPGTQKNNAGG